MYRKNKIKNENKEDFNNDDMKISNHTIYNYTGHKIAIFKKNKKFIENLDLSSNNDSKMSITRNIMFTI